MKRWIFIFCPLIMMFILSGFGYMSKTVMVPDALKVKEPTLVSFPKSEICLSDYHFNPPFLGKQFIGFKEALAFKESQGNYFVTNTYGYLGKYQFGMNTLSLVGVRDSLLFLNDPILQEKVFHTNISRNKWILRRDIKRYVGINIRGVEITESGILAAAHLAGPGNVQIYLRSQGAKDVTDGYGTSISHYLKKFAGYDISMIAAIQNPRI